jgi:hypothetical protein
MQHIPQLVVYDRKESEDPEIIKLYKEIFATPTSSSPQYVFDPLPSFTQLQISSSPSVVRSFS